MTKQPSHPHFYKPPNHHFNYDLHLNRNCHFYFWYTYLNDPVSNLPVTVPSALQAQLQLLMAQFYSTCYIGQGPCFDDPVSKPAHYFTTCTSDATIIYDSSIPATGCTV